MEPLKNIIFDLGGVILTLDRERAVRRFQSLGVANAAELLDPYEQKGSFLGYEQGSVSTEALCRYLTPYAGHPLTPDDIRYAWLGFVVDVPQYKLDYILALRRHYAVYLLSNTNPAIQDWAQSPRFSAAGKPVEAYFDKLYLSYKMGLTKPDPRIFQRMAADAGIDPAASLFVDDGARNIETAAALGFQTYQPANGEDWRAALDARLRPA